MYESDGVEYTTKLRDAIILATDFIQESLIFVEAQEPPYIQFPDYGCTILLTTSPQSDFLGLSLGLSSSLGLRLSLLLC